MCRFKLAHFATGLETTKKFKYITCVGSRLLNFHKAHMYHLFKYITCVGSSLGMLKHLQSLVSLNTSHVSVQAKPIVSAVVYSEFKYITCVGSRKVASMPPQPIFILFKYITCVGSRVDFVLFVFVPILFKYITCVGSRSLLHSVNLPFNV